MLGKDSSIGISCDGAIGTANATVLIRDGVPLEEIDKTTVLYDGVLVPVGSQPPDWYKVEPVEVVFPYPIPEGFSIADNVKMTNLGDENHRIEINTNTTDVLIYLYNNPAAIQMDAERTHAGVCLSEADRPVISCDGATQSFKWAYAVRNGTSSAIALKTYVDGVQRDIINDPPEWLTKDILDEMPAGEVPEGFYISNGVYKFRNNDSSNHRLEFEILNTDFFRSVVSDNPTLVQMTDKLGEHVGVCLSQSTDVIPIGCEGATDRISFAFNTQCQIYINDVYVGSDWISQALWSMHGIKQSDLADNWLILSNLTADYIRVKIVVTGSRNYGTPTDNPTFVDNDGTLTFCLAPTPIGCEGSVDYITVGLINDGSMLDVYLNDKLLPVNTKFFLRNGGGAIVLGQHGIHVEALDSQGLPALMSDGRYTNAALARFINMTSSFQKLRFDLLDASAIDQNNTIENESFFFDSSTRNTSFCLSPSTDEGCQPSEIIMINNQFEGGSVRLDYEIEALSHSVENVSKRFSITDLPQGILLSEIVRQVIAQINEDHPFIAFRETSGTYVANFDFWTYRSESSGTFSLSGVNAVLSEDPIGIKFVKNGLDDDLFPLLFPDAASNGTTSYVAHSCGTQELIGI